MEAPSLEVKVDFLYSHIYTQTEPLSFDVHNPWLEWLGYVVNMTNIMLSVLDELHQQGFSQGEVEVGQTLLHQTFR